MQFIHLGKSVQEKTSSEELYRLHELILGQIRNAQVTNSSPCLTQLANFHGGLATLHSLHFRLTEQELLQEISKYRSGNDLQRNDEINDQVANLNRTMNAIYGSAGDLQVPCHPDNLRELRTGSLSTKLPEHLPSQTTTTAMDRNIPTGRRSYRQMAKRSRAFSGPYRYADRGYSYVKDNSPKPLSPRIRSRDEKLSGTDDSYLRQISK